MEKDRKGFEHKISIESDAVSTEVELRTRELLRLRDEKQAEQEMEETRQVLSTVPVDTLRARFEQVFSRRRFMCMVGSARVWVVTLSSGCDFVNDILVPQDLFLFLIQTGIS